MRPSAPSPVSLRRVLVLKNIAVVGQTLAVLVVAKGMGMPLPFAVIGTVLLVLNLLTWVRLKLLWEVREAEVFAQLLLDLLLLSGLLATATDNRRGHPGCDIRLDPGCRDCGLLHAPNVRVHPPAAFPH